MSCSINEGTRNCTDFFCNEVFHVRHLEVSVHLADFNLVPSFTSNIHDRAQVPTDVPETLLSAALVYIFQNFVKFCTSFYNELLLFYKLLIAVYVIHTVYENSKAELKMIAPGD